MKETFDDRLAALTVRDYVCSNCWGTLAQYPAEGRRWFVLCRKCGAETVGYVTKYFAERRRNDSFGEHAEVRQMLQELGLLVNPHEGKSVEQLLEELGF